MRTVDRIEDRPPATATAQADHPKGAAAQRLKVGLFGHFGTDNFGNEITLQTMLYRLRLLPQQTKALCICTHPESLATREKIEAVPICPTIVRPWESNNPVLKLLRRVFIGIPSEIFRWFDAFRTLKGCKMLIIPGTGLLTDAFGLFAWGPYSLFKWTLTAKLRRCEVLFVSVGAGPVYSLLGRHLVKVSLSLADFRSYRDSASREYLNQIGFRTKGDRIYPDLVFSLPKGRLPDCHNSERERTLVGIGLMEYPGRYSLESASNSIYLAYLDNLTTFAQWLLGNGYDIRLLIGDLCDWAVVEDFKARLSIRSNDADRIADQPPLVVQQLLPQIAETDLVVATRFHNVLLALLLEKPVIAISFHHKCASLMSEMGMAEYCHDINHMNADKLIEQFQDLERNTEKLKPLIRQKVEESRKALDEQYNRIFKTL